MYNDSSVNFAYTLNPNAPEVGYPSGAASSLLSSLNWSQWALWRPELLTFEDPNVLTFTNDTFRAAAMAYLNYLTDQMGL